MKPERFLNIDTFRKRLAELSPQQLRGTFDALTIATEVVHGKSLCQIYGGADLQISIFEELMEMRAAIYLDAVKRTSLADDNDVDAIQNIVGTFLLDAGESTQEVVGRLLDVARRDRGEAA